MKDCVLILENVRSLHNVGSILRAADGFGVKTVYTCGITAHPSQANDDRLPHVQRRADAVLAKTALGAEKTLNIEHTETTAEAIELLKTQGYTIVVLEQSKLSVPVNTIEWPDSVAIVVGNEPSGVEQSTVDSADVVVEIPMFGSKNSHNVVTATAIALTTWRLC